MVQKRWLSPSTKLSGLLLGVMMLAVFCRLLAGPRTIDDSYITFRYARNILAGEGFVYNPGEHVLGTTTPLYTFLMVIMALFTGGAQAPFPTLALFLNALADGLTCWLLFLLGRHHGSTRAGIAAALVWAIAPFSVTFAIGGLETSVYVLLSTATITAHIFKKHILAAFLAGLMLLTRPDALILLGPLCLDRILNYWGRKNRGNPREAGEVQLLMREVAAFLIPVGIWLFFAALYFGSPIPNSIAAKSLAYRLPPEAAFIRLLQHYATPFMEQHTFGVAGIAIGFALYPFLFAIGAANAIKREPHIWPFVAYPWLYFAVFAIANPLIFRWYLTPPLPAYSLFILLGADQLLTAFFKRIKEKSDPHRPGWMNTRTSNYFEPVLIILVIIVPFSLSLRGWARQPDHGLSKPAPKMAWYQLELFYRQAAEILTPIIKQHSDNLEAGKAPLLAAGDVGVLGYFLPARILDTVGLNSPVSTRYYPLDPSLYAINYAIPPDLIINMQPDFIVIQEVYGRIGLLRDQRFSELYHLLKKIPNNIYDSDGMLIFEKN